MSNKVVHWQPTWPILKHILNSKHVRKLFKAKRDQEKFQFLLFGDLFSFTDPNSTEVDKTFYWTWVNNFRFNFVVINVFSFNSR